jgi:ATP/ADP translocase/HEAT repeat protein
MIGGVRLLALRPREGRIVALLAGLFATIEAGRGLGEVAADTLVISRFGAESLPYLFIALGMASMVVALAFGAGIGRFDRRRFLVSVLVVFAAVVLIERLLVMGDAPAVVPVVWISVYVIGAILLTVVWTVAGAALDARQAKRLFPICTSAAIIGGFAGTLAAGPLASLIGTENLLVVQAALLLAGGALTSATAGGSPREHAPEPGTSLLAELRAGFDYVRASPLLRLVAAAYVLFAVLLFSLSFPFLRAMGEGFGTEAELATALGLLSAAITGASFLISVFVANRLYARIGITGAALALPLVYLAGFSLWLMQFNLATAMFVRFAQQVTQRGISNAAWGALYNVVPSRRRPQALAFIDGVPGQLGTSLSGVLLLVVGALLAETQIFVVGAATAALATWVVMRIRARYGRALLDTLRGGLSERVLEGGPGVASLAHEPSVRLALGEALRSSDARSRQLGADLIGRFGRPDMAGMLAPCLDDDDAGVRATAVAAIRELDLQLVLDAAPRLARDPSHAVRTELAMALAQAGRHVETAAVLADLEHASEPGPRAAWLDASARLSTSSLAISARTALTDHSPLVRAAAVRALGSVTRWDPGLTDALVVMLDDDARAVRRAASEILAAQPDTTEAVLAVLRDGSDRAQEAAIMALADAPASAHGRIRDWTLGLIERATVLRGVAREPAATGFRGFLDSVIADRYAAAERRILAAIAALGAPEANGPIRRCLHSADPETRAQAIEALDAIGDPKLGRAVAQLLDSDERRTDPEALIDDADPWIRGLVLATLAGRGSQARAELEGRAAQDPDPVVQVVLPRSDRSEGDAMAPSDPSLSLIDRMLILRRVPIFSRLAPEDLQRLASVAIERRYEPHVPLVTEGDLGDELVVIVEGEVMVVHGDGPEARLIRTYGVGDHIGELAVLRTQPRAATVIACDDGVVGLAIGGAGLRAILEERPEAAMGMLATLADRISAQ